MSNFVEMLYRQLLVLCLCPCVLYDILFISVKNIYSYSQLKEGTYAYGTASVKTSKYECHEIDRRFHALAHLHNVCVKHARKCMIRLQHDKRYAELRQLYNELVKKEKMSKEEKSQKKKLAKQLAACRTEQ